MTETNMGATEITNQHAMDKEINSFLEETRWRTLHPRKKELIKKIVKRVANLSKVLKSNGLGKCEIFPRILGAQGFPRIIITAERINKDIYYDIHLKQSSLLNESNPLTTLMAELKNMDVKTLRNVLKVLSNKRWQRFS
jgi:hypothetical protein